MVLVALTLLVLVGIAAYFVGAIKLAKYGFRLSTAIGLAVILFPPYTFYFAFKKLEVDGKGLPTALCAFGILLSALMISAFYQPLSAMVTGDIDGALEMMTEEIAPQSMTVQEVAEAVEEGDDDALEVADAEAQELADEMQDQQEEQAAEDDADDDDDDDDDDDEDDDEDDDDEDDDEDGDD